MSLQRIGVLLGKELAYSTRNFIFVFATVVPLVMSLVLSLVFGRLLTGAPRLGIVDQGDSQLPAMLQALDYLDTRVYESPDVLRAATERGTVEMGLILPSGFDAAVRSGESTGLTIWFWGEGLVADRATLVTAFARSLVELSGRDVPITVEPVLLGDGEIVSWAERLLPLLVLITIILGGTLVPAVSLVDEKQRRTLSALTITPATVWEVLIAKALLGVGVSLVMGMVILALNRAFGAQPALLALVLGLGAIGAATLGLLLGLVARDITTLFAIVKPLAPLLYAPAIVELIPRVPQWIARVFPTYYLISPIQEIALNGARLADVAPQLAVLVVLITALVLAMGFLTRERSARAAFAA